jgi:coproporphyrinogen III oxidase-like Fe-S oxidoreductase
MVPDRCAVFNYAHMPWMKKQQKLSIEETLPRSWSSVWKCRSSRWKS